MVWEAATGVVSPSSSRCVEDEKRSVMKLLSLFFRNFVQVIKVAKNPIICLCNDRQSMKIKSLAGHCFDIRLRRPTKSSVAQRLVQIGRQEGLMIEPNAAEMLVEQMGNDIRQCINAAQVRTRLCSYCYITIARLLVMSYISGFIDVESTV
jgi:hypothetical protein